MKTTVLQNKHKPKKKEISIGTVKCDFIIFLLLSERGVRVWLTKMSIWKDGKTHPPNDINHDLQENNSTLSSGTDSFHSAEDIDNSCLGRLKRILKRVYKVSSSLVGLIIILICYSFLGAWIFWAIESKHEQTYKHDITLSRRAIVQELMATSMTSRVRVTTEEQLKQMLIDYEADIMEAYKAGVTSSSTEEVWGFWDSLVFCGTVYSTIGKFLVDVLFYSQIVPSSR